MEAKKLYIKSFGCQMNVYDGERMQEMLQPLGFAATEEYADADLVILNTCHIREKASEKVYSDLGRIREEKQKMAANGKKMLIAVAGCTAQAEGQEIMKRAPFVDMVVGPQSYQRLPEMLNYAAQTHNRKNMVELDFASVEKFDVLTAERTAKGVSAFLTIQEGCDKFCTFCVVPYTRGAEISRSVAEVYREALQLVESGAKEITLLGQNVNAYHGASPFSINGKGETWGLAQLVEHLVKIPNLQRIRYTTSHPRDMDAALITAHRDIPQLMPFVHLPVQSGSDRILKEMNRKHSAAEYMDVIAQFRAARPDIQFSSDFIVGFPGESDDEFEATMELVRNVGYAQCYSFMYSPRPGTPAATREDSVPEAVKSQRLQRLQALINAQQLAVNEAAIGQTMDVLFDRAGKRAGQAVGKTPYMQSVTLENAAHLIGTVAPVRITSAHANGVKGEVVG